MQIIETRLEAENFSVKCTCNFDYKISLHFFTINNFLFSTMHIIKFSFVCQGTKNNAVFYWLTCITRIEITLANQLENAITLNITFHYVYNP
jgi:hypothetical protein